ncbi:hypothetical protein EVAR_31478_1 [Eumeta japonica]|uniref:Uncharacterized protein n=1 Tax=Eumeta variegata TaxID=151549 RepID=A0A4C1W976_EUMVA|nr:hypothetical protein EVAR_31478_1 [Eumeta japonica]
MPAEISVTSVGVNDRRAPSFVKRAARPPGRPSRPTGALCVEEAKHHIDEYKKTRVQSADKSVPTISHTVKRPKKRTICPKKEQIIPPPLMVLPARW